MLAHLSKTPGIGGRLKESAEDFVVEEIMPDGTVLELNKEISRPKASGDFTHFILQKKNWNTTQALREVGRILGCGAKRFGFAGTKDRVAVTTQLCSAWRIPPERLLALRLKDIQINGAWLASEEVRLGDLLGNRFRITVRGISGDAEKRVSKICKELGGAIPNYFGEQRFGIVRANTHLVGKAIVKGDFKAAVLNYLCFTDENEMEGSRAARKRLSGDLDFRAAIAYFPRHLNYERTLIAHLAENKNDYVGALRRLPRSLSLMFVHAYQSHLFNLLLGRRVGKTGAGKLKGDGLCGKNSYGFPELAKRGRSFIAGKVIGYETKDLSEEEASLLSEEGIKQKDFFIKSFPEMSAKGVERVLFAPPVGFAFERRGKDGIFSFSLPSGSYATVALREFIDKKK